MLLTKYGNGYIGCFLFYVLIDLRALGKISYHYFGLNTGTAIR